MGDFFWGGHSQASYLPLCIPFIQSWGDQLLAVASCWQTKEGYGSSHLFARKPIIPKCWTMFSVIRLKKEKNTKSTPVLCVVFYVIWLNVNVNFLHKQPLKNILMTFFAFLRIECLEKFKKQTYVYIYIHIYIHYTHFFCNPIEITLLIAKTTMSFVFSNWHRVIWPLPADTLGLWLGSDPTRGIGLLLINNLPFSRIALKDS